MNRPVQEQSPTEAGSGLGLKLRIWIGCLAGALIGAASVLGIAGLLMPAGPGLPPLLVAALPWAAAGLAVAAGFACALWLEHGIRGPLRVINQSFGEPPAAARRALSGLRAWGELDELAKQLHALCTRVEQSGGQLQELRAARQHLEGTLEAITASLERWAAEEPPRPEVRTPAAFQRILDRRVDRESERRQQTRDSLLQVEGELRQDVAGAREAVELAERGFVEATSLLTTLRELQRLSAELTQALVSTEAADGSAAASREGLERYRDAVAEAIEELIAASTASVERLATGLGRVQEVADQVQVLANRATLIALEAAAVRAGGTPAEAGTMLETLAREAQAATRRTADLAADLDQDVASAIAHMSGLRERVAAKLAQAPASPEAAPAPPAAVERLLERVRETVQNGMGKGEQMAATGERASSALERLVRRLEGDAKTLGELAGGLGERGREDER